MKQDFEKTRRTQYTFSDDGLKKSPMAYFVKNKRKSILTFFPPYILLLFIPVLVKHTRVWSNWVNGVLQCGLFYFQIGGNYKSHCQNSSKFLSIAYFMKTADVIMFFFSSHDRTNHTC